MAKRTPDDPGNPESPPGDRPSHGADAGVDSLTYEEAVEALEAIIDRIESGAIGLEASIDAYERGAALVKRCRAVLDRAEQRIDELDAKRLAAGEGA